MEILWPFEALIQEVAHLLQSSYHVVHLNAIKQVGCVSKFGLDTIEFGVQLLYVGETFQICRPEIGPQVFMVDKILDYREALLDLRALSRGLLEPLLEKTGTN